MLVRYSIILIAYFILTSCNSNQDYKKILRFPETGSSNGIYCEKKLLQEGDRILVYGGTNNFLNAHFECDTCFGKVDKLFFSKPTGQIAFISFDNNPSTIVTYSLSLYYWDTKRGYNVSTLKGWERKMTDKELDLLSSDFIKIVKSHVVENNLYFRILN